MSLSYEHEKEIEFMYFKEYMGSLTLKLVAKLMSEEEVKDTFDHIDSLNGEDHPCFEDHKRIRGELREIFEKNITRDRKSYEKSNRGVCADT